MMPHPRRPRGSQTGREKRRDERFQVPTWKLSSRLFSRPDWLPLGLRGRCWWLYSRPILLNFFICSVRISHMYRHYSDQNSTYIRSKLDLKMARHKITKNLTWGQLPRSHPTLSSHVSHHPHSADCRRQSEPGKNINKTQNMKANMILAVESDEQPKRLKRTWKKFRFDRGNRTLTFVNCNVVVTSYSVKKYHAKLGHYSIFCSSYTPYRVALS